MSEPGLNPGALIAAQRVSLITTIIGSIILMVFVGLMTVAWFSNERWGWGVFGVVVIAVNITFVVLQLRKLGKQGNRSGEGKGEKKA